MIDLIQKELSIETEGSAEGMIYARYIVSTINMLYLSAIKCSSFAIELLRMPCMQDAFRLSDSLPSISIDATYLGNTHVLWACITHACRHLQNS
jgi:hypothetical protein